MVAQISQRIARRPRAYVGVSGPDAADYLQRMVSNDVEAVAPGESCDALLLTPKARIIAPLRILRRSADDFLLLTEPELADAVLAELMRMRFGTWLSVVARVGELPGPGAVSLRIPLH